MLNWPEALVAVCKPQVLVGKGVLAERNLWVVKEGEAEVREISRVE